MEKLTKIPKEYLVLGIIIILIILLSLFELNKPSSPTTQIPNQTTQQGNVLEKEEGKVTVTIQYLPEKSDTKIAVFQISFNTHSVDLDSFDPNTQITLEKDGKILKPQSINPTGSSHHKEFDITFEKVKSPFSIVITNLANIPKREFTFTNLN